MIELDMLPLQLRLSPVYSARVVWSYEGVVICIVEWKVPWAIPRPHAGRGEIQHDLVLAEDIQPDMEGDVQVDDGYFEGHGGPVG